MSQTEQTGGTDVLELPRVQPTTNDGDQDRFAHYVRRDRANVSAVTGDAVVALCGKVWVPTRDAKKYPICPRCKALKDDQQSQSPSWPFAD